MYLRYSSSNQTEQSIEGQRRVCEDYARREGITIVREYVDRAISASHDTQKRLSFQRMIKDAKCRDFDLVLVYKLDRFSRDRYDFANYRAKLKDCGVRIQSATEAISDSPESVIMESLLEGMAEYYSRELSQKVLRGMNESAQKRQVLGGVIPLGLMIKDKHYVPDPATRGIVENIFKNYAGGMSLKEIADDLNQRGIRNVSGKKFGPQSVWRILKNEKYAGVYRHNDICDPDAIEPIVSPDLWKQVQEKRKMSEKIRRRKPKTPEGEFLLKGKIFCGYCGYAMVPDSGTSKTGDVHYYYKCNGKKRLSDCRKRNERKEVIESLVIEDAAKMLTDDYIEKIAEIALKEYDNLDSSAEAELLSARCEQLTKEIDNCVSLVGKGVQSDALVSKLLEAEEEKKHVSEALERLNAERFVMTKDHIVHYLTSMRADPNTPDFAKRLVDTFVERVEVFDDDSGDKKKGFLRIKYRLQDGPSEVHLSSANPCHSREQPNTDSLIVEVPGLVLIHTFAFRRK